MTPRPANRPAPPHRRAHFHRIVAACFAGLPEDRMLADAAIGLADVDFVSDRQALSRHVGRVQPAILLLPTTDVNGMPTAPLVTRCLAEAPELLVLMLLSRKAGARRAVREAVRAGVTLESVTSTAELRRIIADRLGHVQLGDDELVEIDRLVDELRPELLRQAITQAAQFAHEQLSVDVLARLVRMKRHVLVRRAHQEHLPPPSEMILWGRLVRASTNRLRESLSLATLTRLSGFATPAAFRRACKRLVDLAGDYQRLLTPDRVLDAIQSRQRARSLTIA
jgi:AraC-like DNA-binding protein